MVVSKDRQRLANTTEVPLDSVLLDSVRTCMLVCNEVSLEAVGSETEVGLGSG